MRQRRATRALLQRFVKDTFRKIGLDVRGYIPNRPDGPAPDPTNKLSVPATASAWLPHRPAPFVLVATNHGTMIVNRNDYNTHGAGDAGYGVGFQLFNTSCCEYDEVRLALALLVRRRQSHGPGVVSVDCGANIGIHTVEWARHMHGWGSVIAIEAQERLYYSLCGNISVNNCLNARALLAAAGSTAGKMRVPVPDYCKPASFGSLELRKRESTEFIGQKIDYDEDSCLTVDMISIDGLQLNRLDLLKIDVEGMEIEVLAGAEESIDAHKPPMIIEILKSDHDQIKSFLAQHGYRYYRFSESFLAVHEADAIDAAVSVADGTLKIDAG